MELPRETAQCVEQITATLQCRIQVGARDAHPSPPPRSNFFHIHAYFGKTFCEIIYWGSPLELVSLREILHPPPELYYDVMAEVGRITLCFLDVVGAIKIGFLNGMNRIDV